MKELLTENEVQLFQKANFKRITIAGGGTIAETISSYVRARMECITIYSE